MELPPYGLGIAAEVAAAAGVDQRFRSQGNGIAKSIVPSAL